MKDLLLVAIDAALKAGATIMGIYSDPTSDFGIERKSDQSPLTIADRAANAVICEKLETIEYPILSEESRIASFEERKSWELFWVVDPLDGTKEFIKRNGEFTVNIALVENGIPILGVVYIPFQKRIYFAEKGIGAFRFDNFNHFDEADFESLLLKADKLPLKRENTEDYIVVASRSHLSEETKEYIHKLEVVHSPLTFISAGSSIKICWVADGTADVYPRFAPTMEWDTAAGHAVALAAGKNVYLTTNESIPLHYNKEDLLNPWFIVK